MLVDMGRVLRGSFNVYQEPPYYDDETGEAVKKLVLLNLMVVGTI